jgi:hypothetical protein
MAGESLKLGLLVSLDGGQKTVAELLAIQKAVADLAKDSPGVEALAQALGITYKEAEKLAKTLDISADRAAAAVSRLQQLNSVSADSKTKFAVLTSELGLTVDQIKGLESAASGDLLGRLGQGAANYGNQVADLAFKFNNVVGAVQNLAAAARPAYDFLIASNEELNQQILKSQTNLASSSRIFQGGQEITDPTAKINASRPQIDAALKQIETDTQSLVGVTSAQVNDLFQVTLTNAAELNKQSKQFPDPISAATSLTKGWAASLQVLGVEAGQARSEINAILKGQVNADSDVAKNLNITNEQVKAWKSQGILVDELNKRLETFVAGNAIAARSVAGIGSNIQDIVERLGRTVGQPLMEPFITALEEIYKFVQTNEGAIVQFFQSVTGNALVAGGEIGKNLLPVLQTLIDFVAEAAPLAQNLFTLIGNGVAVVSQALGPLLTTLGQVIVTATDGLAKLSELALLNQINDAADAIAVLDATTNNLSQSSTDTASALKVLNQAQADGGKLTAEQAARQEDLQKKAKLLVPALDEQIAAYKAIAGVTPEVQAQINANIKSLEAQKKALGSSSGGITIQAKELQSLGTTYEQLGKQAKDAQAGIDSQGGGDSARFKESAQQLVDVTQQQLELGQITKEQAAARLTEIANNTRVEVGVQKSASEAISKIRQQELSQQKSDLDAQIAQVEASAADGTKGPVEAAQEVTRLKKEQLDLQLADVQAAIAAETKAIAEGRGSASKLKGLQSQQKSLQAQSQKEAADGAKRVQDARFAEIDKVEKKAVEAASAAETQRQIETQKLINQGVLRKEDAEQKKLESSKQTISAELAAEKASQAALSATPKTGNKKLDEEREAKKLESKQRTAQLTLKLLENEQQQQEAITRAVQRRIDTQYQQTKNALEAQTQAIQQQLVAQEALTKGLERQQSILAAQKSLQGAISGLSQGQFSTAISLLEGQFAQEDKLKSAQEKRAELQKQLNEPALQLKPNATPEDKEAFAKEQEAQAQRKAAAKTELDALDKQAARENRIQALRLEAERAKLAQLLQSQALERQSLDLEIQKTAALRQQEEIRLRIDAIQAKAATAQAQADLAKLQADKTSTPEAIKAAQLQVQASQAKESGVVQQQQALTQQKTLDEQLAGNQRAVLGATQQGQVLQQKTAIAGLTTTTADDAQLQQQALTQARESTAALSNSFTGLDTAAMSLKSALEALTSGVGAVSVAPIQARKDGGGVEAGMPYLVGEEGPELILPSRDGWVMTASQTAGLLNGVIPGNLGGIAGMPSAPGYQELVAEVKGLREQLGGLEPKTTNNFEIVADQDPYDRMAQIAATVNRSRWK